MEQINYPTIIKTYEEYDKILQYNEERSNGKKFDWFLEKTPLAQFIYVQDYKMSNNFIVNVYSKVQQKIRDNIMKNQHLTKEGFNKIDKHKINWEVFCCFQPLATDINLIREYVDYVDWISMSKRCDLPFDLVREFKDKLYWDIVTYWNGKWRKESVYNKKPYKNEFKKYFIN